MTSLQRTITERIGAMDLKGIGDLFKATSYSEQARQIIKRLILDGTYQPGQRIKESEIAKALGISRSPVREAVMMLSNEGLIELHPQRGIFVHGFDLPEIRELYEVRQALEGQAVRLAAERAGREEIAKLREFLDLMERVLEENEAHPENLGGRTPTDPFPADLDFHMEVAKLANNERLTGYVEEVNTQLQLAKARSTDRPGRAREAHREHLAIYEAMKNGDSDEAERAMKANLQAVLRGIEERLGGGEPA